VASQEQRMLNYKVLSEKNFNSNFEKLDVIDEEEKSNFLLIITF